MNYIKRLGLLGLLLLFFAFSACSADTPAAVSDPVVRVGALRGPTGMGISSLMAEAEAGNTAAEYEFTLGGSPDEMTAGLLSGSFDIAALPLNVASTLYHASEGDVQVIAINALGSLFVLDADGEIMDIEDLRGQTLHMAGEGSAPQFVLAHLLETHGLDPLVDLEIIFHPEHAALAALMIADEVSLALLPQPFATTVLMQRDDVAMALDLNDIWAQTALDSAFVQGVFVARTAFTSAYPQLVAQFLEDHARSVSFVNQNPADAAKLIGGFDIIAEAVAARAIAYSNLVHIDDDAMVPLVLSFLSVLYEANAASVGGSIVYENFFYLG